MILLSVHRSRKQINSIQALTANQLICCSLLIPPIKTIRSVLQLPFPFSLSLSMFVLAVQVHSSGRLDFKQVTPRSPSRQPSTPSPETMEEPASEEAATDEPPLKKMKTHRIVPDKSTAERATVPLEPPQKATPLDLSRDGKPSPMQTPSSSSLDRRIHSGSYQPGPVHQVFASGLVHQSCTHEKIPQLMNDLLGFIGPM
jgi:hypothetical protein